MSSVVVHCKRDKYDIYIGRPGPWGNPFALNNPKDDSARDEVILKFAIWFLNSDDAKARWMREHVHELNGLTLGCWCAPRTCHGMVLAIAATGDTGISALRQWVTARQIRDGLAAPSASTR